MGNGFDISFLTAGLTNVSKTSSVSSNPLNNDVEVRMASTDVNAPAFSDEDLAQMWLDAGVEPTDASTVASTTASLVALESAGFDLAELDEMFADEPDVVAHTLTAFSNGSASRIERENQGVATLIENLPEGTTEDEFEAFMYAFNVA